MKHIDIINACTDLGVHVNGAAEGPINLTKNLSHSNINNIVTVKYSNVVKEYQNDTPERKICQSYEKNKHNIRLF